jgi:HK97 gp10 family phage protein
MKTEIKIDPKALADVKKTLKQLAQISKQELSNELGISALAMVAKMQRAVPKDTGKLVQQIRAQRKGANSIEVVADTPYAAYVEFGTGRFVDLSNLRPLGIPKIYAEQFKGKGIRKVNLTARPYFFTSASDEFKALQKRVENKIKNIIR